MKILYHIPFTNTIGADHWIYKGWKNAFLDLGHEFFELTANDEVLKKIQEVKPDIFFTAINLWNFPKDKEIFLKARSLGVKFFLSVYLPMGAEPLELIRKEDIADIYFGEREPESMVEFEVSTGKKYHLIPNAADKILHFPVKPIDKYSYDIVFLGTRLPKKEWFFQKILIPLTKKYKVGIFGPQWTWGDNFLRATQKTLRCLKFRYLNDIINRFRISVPEEEERLLYSSAKICLNAHERELDLSQPHYILNQRTFKIPACGGFEICDWVPALRKYFAEDEVIMAKDLEDWFYKIEYYLTHEEERKKIQKKGTERALRDHTYHNRVQLIMALYHSIS